MKYLIFNIFILVFSINIVNAQIDGSCGPDKACPTGSSCIKNYCEPNSDAGSGKNCLTNPLTGQSNCEAPPSPSVMIGQIIKTLLGIVGSVALAMFIYGGFTWMLSGGSSEKIQKGKNIIMWATIGLIIIFSSYAAVRFVIEGIAG